MFCLDINDLYCEDDWRNHSVVSLNYEACKILEDSFIMKNYKKLSIEILETMSKGLDAHTPYITKFWENSILEIAKVELALEIHIKSLLLYNKCIVHYIYEKDSSLCNKQKRVPVFVDEYIRKHKGSKQFGYLKNETLKPWLLLRKGYIKRINLDENIMRIFGYLVKTRNSIHFPIDRPNFVLAEQDIMYLVKYVNENIVDFSYKIVDDNGFNKNMKLIKF